MSEEITQTSGMTLSQSRRNSAHAELQAIDGAYYNITDSSGAPLAGLLVLMDRKKRPVRAELHLDESTTGAFYDQAVRQAQLLVADRCFGSGQIPLIVLYARLAQDRIPVALQAPPPPSGLPGWVRPTALALLALIIFGTAGWFLNDLVGGAESDSTQLPAAVTAQPVTAEVAAQPPVAEQPEGRIIETNGLSVSRNAPPLDLGQKVQLKAGIQGVTLRTLAGASAGEVIGYLEPSMQATLINGPIWLQGNSDTIVWWFVRTDSGIEAWTPANTSEFTLLEAIGE
ncbi:MAG: hypothetical protein DWI57_14210 [Chloroflexi bacterium]|nr:MAG: hypothetical protein DWI57_14210 [Chloroflexota bacterium]